MRVLGVDPGLTRCGLAVVDRSGSGKLQMIDVGVIYTDKDAELATRLLELDEQLAKWILSQQFLEHIARLIFISF